MFLRPSRTVASSRCCSEGLSVDWRMEFAPSMSFCSLSILRRTLFISWSSSMATGGARRLRRPLLRVLYKSTCTRGGNIKNVSFVMPWLFRGQIRWRNRPFEAAHVFRSSDRERKQALQADDQSSSLIAGCEW